MRLPVLAFLACLGLLAACTSSREETVDVAGSGQGADAAGQQQVAVSPIAPGTEEDFSVNVGDRVFFPFDRSDLSPESRSTLDRQAAWLRQYPNLDVLIEGHADERGTREYNLALGERRANSVRNYLIASGVDASRLSTISYGKERPAVAGSNEQAWAQNRRAVTQVN